jgi:chromosome segregation ATPase
MGLATALRGDRSAQEPAVDGQGASASVGRRTAKALEALAQLEHRLARWRDQIAIREQAVAGLEEALREHVASADVAEAADGPEGRRLTEQLERTRRTLETERSGLAACQAQVREARQLVLTAELADVRDELAAAEQRKTDHDARLAKLLAAVSEHDGGAEYVLFEPTLEHVVSQGPGVLGAPSRSGLLAVEVARLRTRVWVLEQVVAGQPVPLFDVHGGQIPVELYSPRVKGPEAFPEFQA